MRLSAMIVFRGLEAGGPLELPHGSGYAPHARLPDGTGLPVILHDVPVSATAGVEQPLVIEFRHASQLDYCPLLRTSFDLVMGPRLIGRAWITQADRDALV